MHAQLNKNIMSKEKLRKQLWTDMFYHETFLNAAHGEQLAFLTPDRPAALKDVGMF